MLNPKEGDLFTWSYNCEYSEKYKLSLDTLYWCKSQIFIFKNGKFTDTYWCGSTAKTFTIAQAKEQLDTIFLANINDLDKSDEAKRAYYLDSDFVDISHKNMARGGFYIKKGAKKSLAKMRTILERDLMAKKQELEYLKNSIIRQQETINTLTLETIICVSSATYLDD
ncbi:MAG: hypothetical protein KAT04_06180 [Methylococcales bacterium]|nr:hypothetical protein [Methylococcales bacterium]